MPNLPNCDDIAIYPYALSEHSGIAGMMMHTANTGENSTKSKLYIRLCSHYG